MSLLLFWIEGIMLNVKTLILLGPGSSQKSTQIIQSHVSVSNWFKSKKESLQASHSAHFGKNIQILVEFYLVV